MLAAPDRSDSVNRSLNGADMRPATRYSPCYPILRKFYEVESTMAPSVKAFFDEPTNTATFVVRDPASKSCAIIDSVLDLDYAAGRISTKPARSKNSKPGISGAASRLIVSCAPEPRFW